MLLFFARVLNYFIHLQRQIFNNVIRDEGIY